MRCRGSLERGFCSWLSWCCWVSFVAVSIWSRPCSVNDFLCHCVCGGSPSSSSPFSLPLIFQSLNLRVCLIVCVYMCVCLPVFLFLFVRFIYLFIYSFFIFCLHDLLPSIFVCCVPLMSACVLFVYSFIYSYVLSSPLMVLLCLRLAPRLCVHVFTCRLTCAH